MRSQKFFREESLFLNEKGRMSYNEICTRCANSCKQSHIATLIHCPRYASKNSKITPLKAQKREVQQFLRRAKATALRAKKQSHRRTGAAVFYVKNGRAKKYAYFDIETLEKTP